MTRVLAILRIGLGICVQKETSKNPNTWESARPPPVFPQAHVIGPQVLSSVISENLKDLLPSPRPTPVPLELL